MVGFLRDVFLCGSFQIRPLEIFSRVSFYVIIQCTFGHVGFRAQIAFVRPVGGVDPQAVFLQGELPPERKLAV